MQSKAERIEQLISRLSGTTNSLDRECEDLDLSPLDDEVTQAVDMEIFCCTDCCWWCPIDEESSEDVGAGDLICSDCAENY